MSKPTQHDLLVIGLQRLGAEPVPSKNKYTMLKRLVKIEGWPYSKAKYYFVGPAGALRTSWRPNASTSLVCSDTFRQRVFDAAKLAPAGL